ncbi:ABC transporter substrate-binding protein [Pseudofulvibacter geojedonensis]|uniref:ABC transporter substrate-binding protein n=1 Tax=Pseudofulvibacter geojedonensis TaxID=1123758 RepID=A0ABW3HZH2_9FLAO
MKTVIIHIIKLLAFTAFIILSSCSSKENNNKDHLVFRYNEYSNIQSLDPAFARVNANIWACNQLFNSLVQLDDSLHIQPDIAKSWKISDDALRYTFKLRNDIYFHKHQLFGKDSTRLLTAKDVKYSLERLIDDKVASPGRWVMKPVKKILATNDSTLTIELEQPFPAFLGLMSMKYCSVVPQEIVEYYGNDFRSNPIGTGPFHFKNWIENTKLVLRKNPLYYEKDANGKQLPYLEAVAISFLTDKQSEFLQFAQGNIDFVSGLDPSYKDEILTADGKLREKYLSSVEMLSGDYLNTEYLGFYLDGNIPEIQSELIRKAINYGFDKQTMVTYLRNGVVTPAVNGFIPKGLPSFNNLKGYTYQPEKAKQLVEQFIKETGISQPKITISTDSNYVDLCEYIQRELEKIGLTVTVDLLTSSTFRQEKSAGKLDIFRASWVADYPDAENYLSLFYSKNFTPNGPNYTHFKNATYDSLYEHSLVETNLNKRQILYQKMDSIVINKAPIVPLYYDKAIRFTRKNINGLGINPINLLHLKRVYKNKK